MQKDIALTGLTTTPSSHEAPDGDIAAMLNLINEDSALKPIHKPYTIGTLEEGAKLWVHETPDYLHYIKRLADGKWYWTDDLSLPMKKALGTYMVSTYDGTYIEGETGDLLAKALSGEHVDSYSIDAQLPEVTTETITINNHCVIAVTSATLNFTVGNYIKNGASALVNKVRFREEIDILGEAYKVYTIDGILDGTSVEVSGSLPKSWTRFTSDLDNTTNVTDLTYNGNIVTVASEDQPVQYVIFDMDNDNYKYLGQIPDVKIQFKLEGNVAARTYAGSVQFGKNSEIYADDEEGEYTKVLVSIDCASTAQHGSYTKRVKWEALVSDGIQAGVQYRIKAADTNSGIVAVSIEGLSGERNELSAGQSVVQKFINGRALIISHNDNLSQATIEILAKEDGTEASSDNEDDTVGAYDTKFYAYNTQDNLTSILGIVNAYSKLYSEIRGYFIFPFFVTYGLKMYDGTIAKMSAPELMVPNWGVTPVMTIDGYSDDSDTHLVDATAQAFVCSLFYRVMSKGNLDDWKDVITDVVIGISQPIYRVNGAASYTEGYFQTKCYSLTWGQTEMGYYSIMGSGKQYLRNNLKKTDSASCVLIPPKYTNLEFKNNLLNAVNFYELKDIKADEIVADGIFNSIEMDGKNPLYPETGIKMTCDNLASNLLYANKLKEYNGRLHLIGAKEKLGTNAAAVSPLTYEGENRYKIETVTKKNGREYRVRTGWLYGNSANMLFFTSTDPDISEANIYITADNSISYIKKNIKVVPRDIGNGSYAYMPDDSYYTTSTCTQEEADADPTGAQIVPHLNEIYVSEVDNPFVFPSANAVQCGRGAVNQVAVNTETISEGQFGSSPLYAFTDEETWVLSLADTGVYQTQQVLNNSVCINTNSITGLTNGVIYTTVNGIMYATGKEVTCISDSLRDAVSKYTLKHLGKIMAARDLTDRGDYLPDYTYDEDWLTFLRTCGVQHDKVNERIIIYPEDSDLTFVYSLRSNQWGMMGVNISGKIDRAGAQWVLLPNDDGTQTIADLADPQYSDEENQTTEYDKQYVITRPIGLDLADIHKRINSLIMRGYFRKGSVACGVYGSRDLFHWHLIWTSKDQYLRGQSGTPYKYFIVVAVCNLAEDERLQGMSFDFDTFDTDQQR